MTTETFTDDVTSVLAPSLLGPLQVADAGDTNSWIRINPAAAAIEAAGDARPIRRIVLPFSRVYSTATASTIGVVISSYYVTSITNGGFHVSPFPIPVDMDVTASASVRTLVAPLASSSQTAPVVRLVLGYTYGKVNEIPTDGSLTLDWTAPDNWTADEPRSVLLDDGNARTFAPNTFEHGDEVGLRISRVGSATEDTFNKSLKIAERLVFEYSAQQF